MRHIDEVIGGIRKEGRSAGSRRPSGLRIAQGNALGYLLSKRCIIQPFQVLAHRSAATGRVLPDVGFIPRHGEFGTGFSCHNAGIHRKAFTFDQAGRHAGTHDLIE